MTVYTYVVDHAHETPAVGAQTNINGGKLQAVMFDDGLARLEAAEDLLRELARTTKDEQTRYSIEDFMGERTYRHNTK